MNFKQLCTDLIKEADPQKAETMTRLMGSEFKFLGVDAKARRRIMQPYLREAAETETEIDWDFVACCWDQNLREFRYLALQYLLRQRNLLANDAYKKLEKLMKDQPGWDTGNYFQKIVNFLTARYPQTKKTVLRWSNSDDPWFKRVALLHQLDRGAYADLELQEKILLNCLGAQEKPVKLAVGRCLRDLQRSFPDFVRQFCEDHADGLSPLSLKELKA